MNSNICKNTTSRWGIVNHYETTQRFNHLWGDGSKQMLTSAKEWGRIPQDANYGQVITHSTAIHEGYRATEDGDVIWIVFKSLHDLRSMVDRVDKSCHVLGRMSYQDFCNLTTIVGSQVDHGVASLQEVLNLEYPVEHPYVPKCSNVDLHDMLIDVVGIFSKTHNAQIRGL